MEGRAIARPNPLVAAGVKTVETTFNGGPSNCPAKPETGLDPGHNGADCLQWRAEQLPGQTGSRPTLRRRWPESFNGGPSNCPAKRRRDRVRGSAGPAPSMEGRAIARPNEDIEVGHLIEFTVFQWRAEQLPGQTSKPTSSTSPPASAFNGGPSNCPAKRYRNEWPRRRGTNLQWRAEQLPGQTRLRAFSPIVGRDPSMEGRAIARPNRAALAVPADLRIPSMEGRAIARPNPKAPPPCRSRSCFLQWRAEQLPGQTRVYAGRSI